MTATQIIYGAVALNAIVLLALCTLFAKPRGK